MKLKNAILCGLFLILLSNCGSNPVQRCQDRRKVMRDAVCQAVSAHIGTSTYNDSLVACLLQDNEYNDCSKESYFK
ncbi:hypothetical protein EHQ53_05040 [Leptospira langatensis]|uniref:Uncharacterized protein n=1 Tax=Leptospira langatensis TaxID=2484983 RepID=A0A5F1ZT42_9LEPT|nr:hypothetical protein [Leptospira langatensis]TGK02840.1 hypothetical protein EHO57_05875 [Leptospira langatensis]TGL41594.1 hypothetical protein EHQ53_05040 [Leptospira langatensis]